MIFYRIAFWLPGIIAAFGLRFAWSSGILQRPWLVVAVFLLGLLLQATGGMFSPMWATGLVCQVALALFLLVKIKLDTV